jgi:hypothetical protein
MARVIHKRENFPWFSTEFCVEKSVEKVQNPVDKVESTGALCQLWPQSAFFPTFCFSLFFSSFQNFSPAFSFSRYSAHSFICESNRLKPSQAEIFPPNGAISFFFDFYSPNAYNKSSNLRKKPSIPQTRKTKRRRSP